MGRSVRFAQRVFAHFFEDMSGPDIIRVLSAPRLTGILLAWALVFSSERVFAREGSISPTVQSVLFAKIVSYNRTLESKPNKVLIVHPDDKSDGVEELEKAFATVNLPASRVKASAAPAYAGDASVVYVMHGVNPSAFQQLCEKGTRLSITANEALAKSGDVSVALGVKDSGRPDIIIHLGRAKTEGQEFQSALLALATVLR